jgi:curved DNA-binding protein CbpA
VFADRARSAEIAGLDRARLDEVPFALLLLAHHQVATSGMLVAQRGRVEKRILLADGTPVDCRSNLIHETLSRYLVSIGRLTRDQETAALSHSIAEGKLFGQILVEQSLIDDAELHKLLQQNLARKLLDLFTWRDGEVAVERGAVASDSEMRVRVPQLVLTGVTRFMPREGLERAMAPLASAPLARGEMLPRERETLRLGERERVVLAALDRPRRFEELLASPAGKPAEMARSVLALAMLGGVVPAPDPPAAPPLAPAAASPAPNPTPAVTASPVPAPPPTSIVPPVGAAAPGAVPAAAEREAIRRAYAGFRDRDPFDLLGVDELATAREIEQRFLAFSRTYAPWPWRDAGEPEVAERVAEIFLAGVAAYAKLRDPDAYEGLLRSRRERRAAATPAKVRSLKIETDLLDADVQFRKGLALKRAGKLDLAQQQLDFAADCDAQNGLYLAEAAHCRYLLAPSAHAARSFEELLDAQRVDPTCAESYLYGGEIAAALGRIEAAEEQYRLAAKRLGPEDRRALDALAELGQRRRKRR